MGGVGGEIVLSVLGVWVIGFWASEMGCHGLNSCVWAWYMDNGQCVCVRGQAREPQFVFGVSV